MKQQFGLNAGHIGYMFLLLEGVYCISGQVTGQLLKRFNQVLWWPVFGITCIAVACLISGPMWPLTFELNIPLEVIRLIIIGLGAGMLMVGSFIDGSADVATGGPVSDQAPALAFSALYGSSFNLGSVEV